MKKVSKLDTLGQLVFNKERQSSVAAGVECICIYVVTLSSIKGPQQSNRRRKGLLTNDAGIANRLPRKNTP